MDNSTIENGKTIALISYLTWIGTIIAFIMNGEKRNSFASFHIRQMIGLSLFSFINALFIVKYIGFWVAAIISLVLFVFWMIGFMGAIKGEEKKIPYFADIFQEWFKSIA
ncbi:DUF4870 domain-containing protein [Lutibacter sp.]|uniref:DUF4870 domain-containing protein n=1 Tax=Lutibacter sp. TaxID=1925666 RepID=UPI0027356476|nr:hypothetical protein [Lutibacter sp.]MDP3313543.1 hypothetical protein [Lutibacter sp.]